MTALGTSSWTGNGSSRSATRPNGSPTSSGFAVVSGTVTAQRGGTSSLSSGRNRALVGALNTFLEKYGLGTAFGNVVEKRYLVGTTYAKHATSEAEQKKFRAPELPYVLLGAEHAPISSDPSICARTGNVEFFLRPWEFFGPFGLSTRAHPRTRVPTHFHPVT